MHLSRRTFAAGLIAAIPTVGLTKATVGFDSNPQTEWLPDGRRMKLLKQLRFYDPNLVEWVTPKGAIVDGASIPQAFWSIMGGPFEGRYRNASIIHDWYCDRRTRPWEKVHRVFYDGMIVSGVPENSAKTMYSAVVKYGPRWSDTVVENNNLKVAGLSSAELGNLHYELSGARARAIVAAAKDATGIVQATEASFSKEYDAAMRARPKSSGKVSINEMTGNVFVILSGADEGRRTNIRILEHRTPTEADVRATIEHAPKLSLEQIEAGL